MRLIAGRGGNGISTFSKTFQNEFGGPNGGDGGNGAHIILQGKSTKITSTDSAIESHVRSFMPMTRCPFSLYINLPLASCQRSILLLLASKQLSSLNNIRKIYKADSGEPGEAGFKKGKSAEHLMIEVNSLTLRFFFKNEVLFLLIGTYGHRREEDKWQSDLWIAKAWRKVHCRTWWSRWEREVSVNVRDHQSNEFPCIPSGGKGNYYFLSNMNRAPTEYELGAEGDKKDYKLELQLIAHFGLVSDCLSFSTTNTSVVWV